MCENDKSTRAGRWKRFDENRGRIHRRVSPPAFIESNSYGLWSVQYLVTPPLVTYGLLTRLFQDPPSIDPSEPYYNGWPGDHRGWMRFASLVDARDFYLFETERLSFQEYRDRITARAKPEHPAHRYAIDESGSFVEHPDFDKLPTGQT